MKGDADKKQTGINAKFDILTKRQELGKKFLDEVERKRKAVHDRIESSVAPITDKNIVTRLAKKTARVTGKTAHLLEQTVETTVGLAGSVVTNTASAINKRRIAGTMAQAKNAGLNNEKFSAKEQEKLRKEAISEGINAGKSAAILGAMGIVGAMSAGGAPIAMAAFIAPAKGVSASAFAAQAAAHPAGGFLGQAGAELGTFSNTMTGQAIFNAAVPFKVPYVIFKTKFSTPEQMLKTAKVEEFANAKLAKARGENAPELGDLPAKSQYLIDLQKELKTPVLRVEDTRKSYEVVKDDSNPLVKELYAKITKAEELAVKALKDKGFQGYAATLTPQEKKNIRKEVVREEFERVKAELVEKRMHDVPGRGNYVKAVEKVLESAGEAHSQDSRENRLLRAVATYQSKVAEEEAKSGSRSGRDMIRLATGNKLIIEKKREQFAKELVAQIDRIYPEDFQGPNAAKALKEDLNKILYPKKGGTKQPNDKLDNAANEFYKKYAAEEKLSPQQKSELFEEKLVKFNAEVQKTKKNFIGQGSSQLEKLTRNFIEEIDRLYPNDPEGKSTKPKEVENLRENLIKAHKGKTTEGKESPKKPNHSEIKKSIVKASNAFTQEKIVNSGKAATILQKHARGMISRKTTNAKAAEKKEEPSALALWQKLSDLASKLASSPKKEPIVPEQEHVIARNRSSSINSNATIVEGYKPPSPNSRTSSPSNSPKQSSLEPEQKSTSLIIKKDLIDTLSHNIAQKLFGDDYDQGNSLTGLKNQGRINDKQIIQDLLTKSFANTELEDLAKIMKTKNHKNDLVDKLSKDIKEKLTTSTKASYLTGNKGIQLKTVADNQKTLHANRMENIIDSVKKNAIPSSFTNSSLPNNSNQREPGMKI